SFWVREVEQGFEANRNNFNRAKFNFTTKARRTLRKWHISQTILGALAFLGVLGGKAFCVSTEKDTLPSLVFGSAR
ncbi:MAG: hypothetical protein OXG23_01790, partial [Chloroflexi bacterium]|nr:hypothetical protein [Chloroflexota bacterium]